MLVSNPKPQNLFQTLEAGRQDFRPDTSSADFTPTNAEPGSEAKILVFIERLRQGLPLVHPADRRDDTRSSE